MLPPPLPLNELDVDRRNALVYEAKKDRPLQDVLNESAQVHRQLRAFVHCIADADFENERRTACYVEPYWTESIPLSDALAADSFEHYHEHILSIRAWLA